MKCKLALCFQMSFLFFALSYLQLEKREPDDPGRYLLAIWTPGGPKTFLEKLKITLLL